METNVTSNNVLADEKGDEEGNITEIQCCDTNQNCLISTITASTSEESFRIISREHFITKDQEVNNDQHQKDGKEWNNLRKKIRKEIDSNLKTMMILRAQELGIKYNSKTGPTTVQTFNDIGQAWHDDDSHKLAIKLNDVMHASFEDECGYEFYMENTIMKKMKLKYDDKTPNIKGSIARMIVNRKCEITKVINKRAEKSHQKKLYPKETRVK